MNTPSIITFSRRTDPAFHMDWFMESIEKGGCYVPNPFSGKPYYVSLKQQDVLLFNFWTKNPGATLLSLETLIEQGYAMAYFITVTGYPEQIEAAVLGTEVIHAAVCEIRRLLGKHALWWRYDPIVVTEKLTAGWHIKNFKRLCAEVWAGNTERVVISLAHIDGPYASIRRLLSDKLHENDDRLIMPDYDRFISLAATLSEIAYKHGIHLEVCCSPSIMEKDRHIVSQGSCLSARYVQKVVSDLPRIKQKGIRKSSAKHGYAACSCLESRDIGTGGTCAHGCVYCYANRPGKKANVIH